MRAPWVTGLPGLGTVRPELVRFALGRMGMSAGNMYGGDAAESSATIHAALERGVSLLDTGAHDGKRRGACRKSLP